MVTAAHPDIELVVYPTASALLKDCESLLYDDEVENNQLISLLEIARLSSPGNGQATWFGALKSQGESLCCAANFEIDGLCMSTAHKRDAERLIAGYCDLDHCPHRVFGPYDETLHAVARISRSGGQHYEVTGHWQAFATQSGTSLRKKAVGRCRPARESDLDVVRRMGAMYEEEEPAFISNEEYLVNKLYTGNLWCWEDGEVTSLLAVAGIIRSGFRIAALFTPKSFRGCGYASSLIDAVVDHYLAEDLLYATVYADAENEKVVGLYESLGFDRIGKKVELTLQP